jgi:hypothetical protein
MVGPNQENIIKLSVSDEEIAYRLVSLYFEEIARLGFKRTLSLDAIMNAYFYALERLRNKEKELAAVRRFIEAEEDKLYEKDKKELFPAVKE